MIAVIGTTFLLLAALVMTIALLGAMIILTLTVSTVRVLMSWLRWDMFWDETGWYRRPS